MERRAIYTLFALIVLLSPEQALCRSDMGEAGNVGTPARTQFITVVGKYDFHDLTLAARPTYSLNEDEIRALPVDTLEELSSRVLMQLGVPNGVDPIYLVNGHRVSLQNWLKGLPARALLGLEAYTSSLSIQLGYSASQPIINIKVPRKFKELLGRSTGLVRKGRIGADVSGDASLFDLNGSRRITTLFEVSHTAEILTQSARSSASSAGILSSEMPFIQSVIPSESRFRFDSSGALPISRDFTVSFGLNGRMMFSRSVLATDPVNGEYAGRTSHWEISPSSSIDGFIGRWSINGILNAELSRDRTSVFSKDMKEINQGLPRSEAESVVTYTIEGSASGPLVRLFGREVSSNLNLSSSSDQATFDKQDTDSTRRLVRRKFASSASFSGPLIGAAGPVGSYIGAVNVSLKIGRAKSGSERFRWTYGYGLNWIFRPNVSFNFTRTMDYVDPTIRQLAAPQFATPNVVVYDRLLNKSAEVELLSGGRESLKAVRSKSDLAELTIRPGFLSGSSVSLSLKAENKSNSIFQPRTLLLGNDELSELISDRNSLGELTTVDDRPLNINAEKSRGISLSLSQNAVLPGWNHVGGRVSDSNGKRTLTKSDVELLASLGCDLLLSHRVRLLRSGGWISAEDVPGVSGFDDESKLRFIGRLAAASKIAGAEMTMKWSSPVKVTGDIAASELRFGRSPKVDLELFRTLDISRLDLNRSIKISIKAQNLFNSRTHVSSLGSEVPYRLRPGYLDPVGRSLLASLRVSM